MSVLNFPRAGVYPIELLQWDQNPNESSLLLLARRGGLPGYDSNVGQFYNDGARFVGDVDRGGLRVWSELPGLDLTGVGRVTGSSGFSVIAGQSVQLTAEPAAGWTFVRWDGDVSGSNPVLALTPTSDLRIKPIFATTVALSVPAGNGSLTATPAATATAYVPNPVMPFVLGEHVDGHIVINNPADVGGSHRFVQLTCVNCASGWELAVLNQLPTYAPIVVYANGRVEMSGAWLIRVQPVSDTNLPALATVAHLFERLPNSPITAITWRNGATRAESFPPERFVEVDGRQKMGRVLVCLVGVLFCSLASFYIGVAVMKRMHAAVGYRPEQ
jgi:hypothetical protein